MTKGNWPKCAHCQLKPEERACRGEGKRAPVFCPMTLEGTAIERSREEYREAGNREFACRAALQEASGYEVDKADPENAGRLNSPLEIAEFAHRMGYRRLGLAFCTGLHREAAAVTRVLEGHGFDVVSVVCKVGRISKEEIGVQEKEKISPGKFESMCNPIGQAKVLNAAATDFNVVLGLCVGHDSLFFKYSQAPTTVLAAKDRVTGHNPLAVVYTLDHYYSRLLKP